MFYAIFVFTLVPLNIIKSLPLYVHKHLFNYVLHYICIYIMPYKHIKRYTYNSIISN